MSVKRVGIFGTSGMAREAGDVANDLGYTPLYVARDQSELNAWKYPAEAILESDVLRYQNIPFVIGIGENNTREKVVNRYRDQLTFCNLIHTSATFGYLQRKAIECKQGIIVCAGVRFTNSILTTLSLVTLLISHLVAQFRGMLILATTAGSVPAPCSIKAHQKTNC
jgi:hypothetical protein